MELYDFIIIGSGFGGQCAAINLLNKGQSNFIILERRDFMGGTWIQNTYPGAAVDIPSPLYSLSTDPFRWSQMFADQNELKKYTEHIIDKYQLQKKARPNIHVSRLVWQDDKKVWGIHTKSGEIFNAKFVINATGALSNPVIPAFKGKERFKGVSFHVNQWNHEKDYRGKRVAVIGSGSSAIQVIPSIAPEVDKLYVFQRTPHWVLPRPDKRFNDWQRKLLSYQWCYRLIRFFIYWGLETRVLGFKYSHALVKLLAQGKARRHLHRQVSDENLRHKLLPEFTLGCKRVVLSNDYYPTLMRNNVRLMTGDQGIECITERGVLTQDGQEIELDMIIYATGYDGTDGLIPFPVIGREGHSLQDFWAPHPRAYLGTTMPYFPNLFLIIGPNTFFGHTSGLLSIEAQMQYILNCIKTLSDLNLQTIEVKENAEKEYTRFIHQEMKKMVWHLGGCDSWFKSKSGHVITMFPGFSFTFRRLTKHIVQEHHLVS